MATPTGQISFADLSVEILQAGSTSQRNMNDAGVRLGYGSTAQLSISQLKKAWGCTVTEGSQSDKFGTQYGYDNYFYTFGSVDDTSITGTTSIVRSVYTTASGATFTNFWGGSGVYETGFRATDVARVAYGGTSVSFTPDNNDGVGAPDGVTTSSAAYYDGTGTTTLGIKWN